MSRALLLILLPLSCAAQAPEVKDADDRMVESCTFVRMVEGNAGLARDPQNAADKARKRGRENAAEAGATHVVWFPTVMSGVGAMIVTGRAYRC